MKALKGPPPYLPLAAGRGRLAGRLGWLPTAWLACAGWRPLANGPLRRTATCAAEGFALGVDGGMEEQGREALDVRAVQLGEVRADEHATGWRTSNGAPYLDVVARDGPVYADVPSLP